MKNITLKTIWVDQITDTTKEEYPTGWSGEVSNDRAERAERAGVLDDAETYIGVDLSSKTDTTTMVRARVAKPKPVAND